jgi:hypothetical protein
MRKHGVDISAAGAATVAFGECDGVEVLAHAMAAAHAFDAAALRRAMDVAGPRLQSALTWRSALSAARADLPGAVRDIGFDGAAFRYLSTVDRRL